MKALLLSAALTLTASTAFAQQDPIRIGLMGTVTGPAGIIGIHMRDGFLLAIEEASATAAGRPIEMILTNPELKPDLALTQARTLIERDQVDFISGIVFSNVLMAVYRPITESETFLIGANAGPSSVAGKRCNRFFFSTSYQNDQLHEVMGQYASDQEFEDVIVIAPNYQAGRDAVTGFSRAFEGEPSDIIYTPLGAIDFSSEIARIAQAGPEAIFTFMPGGMGVSFVRQFRQAGLVDDVAFLSAFTVDGATLSAMGDDAVGLFGASQWATTLDTPGNAEFVESFEATYGYVPAPYAAQGYDAARLIISAIEAVGGDLKDKDAVHAAITAADFVSVRGDFSFNNNQFPIQDFYLTEATKAEDGAYVMQHAEKVFNDVGDAYAADCEL